MTALIWIREALELPLSLPEDGLVWTFRMDGPAAQQVLESVRPSRADLADAARAREDAGAPRLLRQLLLRAVAARLLDRHADDIEIVRNARGSLTLPGCDLHASVSGSGAYAAIALSRHPVGVDIEVLDAGAQTAELRRWTALEAMVKSAGTGFGDAMPDYPYVQSPNGFAFREGLGRLCSGAWLCTPDFVAAAVTRSLGALA